MDELPADLRLGREERGVDRRLGALVDGHRAPVNQKIVGPMCTIHGKENSKMMFMSSPVTSHVCVDDAGVHVVDDDVVAALVEALLLNPGCRLSSHVAKFHNCSY